MIVCCILSDLVILGSCDVSRCCCRTIFLFEEPSICSKEVLSFWVRTVSSSSKGSSAKMMCCEKTLSDINEGRR